MSLALLPLGLIAFLATVQSSRMADYEHAARMRIAMNESARNLRTAIAADTTSVQSALQAWKAHPEDGAICMRLKSVMQTRTGTTPDFAVFGALPAPICHSERYTPQRPPTLSFIGDENPALRIDGDRLIVIIPGGNTGHIAILSYARGVLSAIGAPSEALSSYRLSLIHNMAELPLVEAGEASLFPGSETMNAETGIDGLSVQMVVSRVPFTAAEFVSTLLPLVMWAAAAGIGWLVVDQLLIRPLRRLERQVSAYTPGQIIPLNEERTTAQELRQLSGAFQSMTEMIANHENALAQSLALQRRLTREVHHRVKNNLQVVASLINLHARGVQEPAVARAYASIQRRVDALAVVHRNHFAELEESRGVQLRSLIGELAQNLRGSAPEGQSAPSILLDINATYARQDIAVPVSFLITELVELAMLCDPAARIAIALENTDDTTALLSISSPAFVRSDALMSRLDDRYRRVLEGLARQLRSPLAHDADSGMFSLTIPVHGDAE